MKISTQIQTFFKDKVLKTAQKLKYPCSLSDYFDHTLYDSSKSYYQSKTRIGRLEKHLNFSSLRGAKDYIDNLNKQYPQGKYLTASELLKPFFGYTIGNYILNNHNQFHPDKPIVLVEIGCGMGGLADSILTYFKNYEPQKYREIQFLTFEITDNLNTEAANLLKTHHPSLWENKQICFVNANLFTDLNGLRINDHSYILAFDFFDAIPHDQIYFEKNFESIFSHKKMDFLSKNSSLINNLKSIEENSLLMNEFKKFLEFFYQENLIQQVSVDIQKGNEKLIRTPITNEELKSAIPYVLFPPEVREYIIGSEFKEFEKGKIRKEDDWFIRLTKKFYNYYFNNNSIWVPTKINTFFDVLQQVFPNNHLIIHDFDFLPVDLRVNYKGINAPIIYKIKENSTNVVNFKDVIVPRGSANVYFPVNFDILQFVYKIKSNKISSIRNYEGFMTEHSNEEWGLSKLGFNPLIETNKNSKFLISLD